MNAQNSLVVFIILLASSMLSCTKRNNKSESHPIQWDTIHYQATTPAEEGNGSIVQDFELLFPIHKNRLKREIYRVVLGFTGSEAIPAKQLVDSLARTNRKHFLLDRDVILGTVYHEQISSFVAYEDPLLLSLAVNYTSFKGADEPSNTVCFYNFILPEGIALSESSIFIDGYEEPLTHLLVEHIKKTYLTNAVVNYDEVRPNGNFKIDTKGITYCFQEKLVLVDSNNEMMVPLSWEELKTLLRESSPINHLIN